jgi:predicted NBD/HSP70 family sugar kinase
MTRPTGSAKLLRAFNSSATLAHLLDAGRLTRAELGERTGLSKPTVGEMLRLLTGAGLAVVVGRTAGGPGPTAEIWTPNPDAAYVLAVCVRDTAGDDRPELAIAVADLTGQIRHRAELRGRFNPAQAMGQALRSSGVDPTLIRRVQVGVPGSYDRRTDTIAHIDVPGWSQKSVTARLSGDLAPGTTVRVENDVNLAAAAERRVGPASTVDSFVLVWLDQGPGLAIDVHGDQLRGARGAAGEIGYLPTGPGGGPSLQELLGGPAVVELARRGGSSARTPEAAVDRADVRAELAVRVAYLLSVVTAVLDPPLVVLGGRMARAGGAALLDAVRTHVRPHPTVELSAVDDDAVLLGALDLAQRDLRAALIDSLAGAA